MYCIENETISRIGCWVFASNLGPDDIVVVSQVYSDSNTMFALRYKGWRELFMVYQYTTHFFLMLLHSLRWQHTYQQIQWFLLTLQVLVSYIYETRARSPLCLLMSQHLTVLGHQPAQWLVNYQTCFRSQSMIPYNVVSFWIRRCVYIEAW